MTTSKIKKSFHKSEIDMADIFKFFKHIKFFKFFEDVFRTTKFMSILLYPLFKFFNNILGYIATIMETNCNPSIIIQKIVFCYSIFFVTTS